LLLENPANDKIYLIQIAYQVGFNNKTTFNNYFKKFVGCTPKIYRNNLQKSASYSTLKDKNKAIK